MDVRGLKRRLRARELAGPDVEESSSSDGATRGAPSTSAEPPEVSRAGDRRRRRGDSELDRRVQALTQFLERPAVTGRVELRPAAAVRRPSRSESDSRSLSRTDSRSRRQTRCRRSQRSSGGQGVPGRPPSRTSDVPPGAFPLYGAGVPPGNFGYLPPGFFGHHPPPGYHYGLPPQGYYGGHPAGVPPHRYAPYPPSQGRFTKENSTGVAAEDALPASSPDASKADVKESEEQAKQQKAIDPPPGDVGSGWGDPIPRGDDNEAAKA